MTQIEKEELEKIVNKVVVNLLEQKLKQNNSLLLENIKKLLSQSSIDDEADFSSEELFEIMFDDSFN